MMDLESFGGLQEQFDSMREQFDPETFDSVYEQILEGLANDFDVLPDGTVINPESFIETLRQPVRDTNNAVELRVESFNASPNPVSAGDVQAQLLDELEQQLETGYEALDDAFNRNEYAEDTLRDIVEQQRESFFSNDEDFPVRSTSESYENRLGALTQNIQNIEQMSQQVVELRNELSEVLQSRRGETSAQEVISAFTRATRETRKDLDISGITLEKDAFVAAHPEFIDEINEIYELMREGIEETRIFFEETGINLQVIADASISVRRNFIEYADELQEAMLDSDPDALIDAAVAYRENHNQLWNEATALYENATAVFIQANQEQGIWVPADIFPLLEDIC